MALSDWEPVAVVTITKGDTLRGPSQTLCHGSPQSRTVVDLSDGSTVAYRMVDIADESVKIANAAANIDDDENGQVSYDFTALNVDTASEYAAWWIRTSNGKTERFPSGKAYIKVVIAEDY